MNKLVQSEDYYCDVIAVLSHRHAHEKNKRKAVLMGKRLSNPLSLDEAMAVLEDATSDLSFVRWVGDRIWLDQNRDLLVYIDDECELDLWSISCRYDHLDPPNLRDEFDLPPPTT